MDLAEAALDDNQGVVAAVQSVAAELEATPAQVALAWLLAQGRNLWCTQSGWSRH
jgi:aryl-alcohol dehydrogenase-like predicted oxidoreductase